MLKKWVAVDKERNRVEGADDDDDEEESALANELRDGVGGELERDLGERVRALASVLLGEVVRRCRRPRR
jgi:hypothetical protein